jgi:3-methyladenine DNA glycosylase AlkD
MEEQQAGDMDLDSTIELLHAKKDKGYLEGMKRFGIDTSGVHALGVSIPELRRLARKLKPNHALALELWNTGIHEARILASMIDNPGGVTLRQINMWVNDFASWDLCDQVCGNLFDRTPFAVSCAKKFSSRKREFVKRAGFVLMAEYAVHDKTAPDEVFVEFLSIIEDHAWDERNFVKKAVNWALRQIGKRNRYLQGKAIETATRISKQDTPSAKWIASDALRELSGVKRKFT